MVLERLPLIRALYLSVNMSWIEATDSFENTTISSSSCALLVPTLVQAFISFSLEISRLPFSIQLAPCYIHILFGQQTILWQLKKREQHYKILVMITWGGFFTFYYCFLLLLHISVVPSLFQITKSLTKCYDLSTVIWNLYFIIITVKWLIIVIL